MPLPPLSQPAAEIFVPDGVPAGEALQRTTHLGIGAHADDLEFFAWHGINACFGRNDLWFSGIVLTDGVGSPQPDAPAASGDELAKVRRAEQRAAAVVGRYSAVVQLAHSSETLKSSSAKVVVDELAGLIEVMQPATVYMHNPFDRHDSHVGAFLRTIAALRRLPSALRPERVYGCEVWRGLDWLVGVDRVGLPSGSRPHLESALAGLFDSQIAAGKRYDLAVVGRRRANATFDESHKLDADAGLTLAVDLTGLVRDDSADPADYVRSVVARLGADVEDRLKRMGGERKAAV